MIRPSTSVVVPVIFLVVFLLFDRQSAFADCRSFSDLIHNGSYAVADHQGVILSACNSDQSFVPASIVKIVTALAAFHLLGRDHRFITELFIDGTGNLYIRGSGDPFLISEEVESIAVKLRTQGLARIKAIFIDNSMYALSEKVPGQGSSDNPYDVPVAATAVNFNTVNISVDTRGRVTSAEPQTPDLPIMQETGRGMRSGTYRLNICSHGCATDDRAARYSAELFRAKLVAQGIVVGSSYGLRRVPPDARRMYVHQNARDLKEVVSSFLEFSNNFVANQVYLACGTKEYGYPATWDKAKKAVDKALAQLLGVDVASQVNMIEGAGLSRRNQVTAGAMLQVLQKFRPYAQLLPEKENTRMKSGTLDGVYNYAGYLPDSNPFVILLNQQKNNRNRILNELQNMYSTSADN